jgi:hypothetical protein
MTISRDGKLIWKHRDFGIQILPGVAGRSTARNGDLHYRKYMRQRRLLTEVCRQWRNMVKMKAVDCMP